MTTTPMNTDKTLTNLLGSWELESWFIHYQDGREPGAPFGSAPSGLLQYHADGSMSATVHRSDRNPFPAGVSPRKIGGDVIVRAYLSYFHYAGTFRVEGDNVIHTVMHSLNQAMVGTEQVRQMQFDPPRLTLVGTEAFSDETRRHELVWHRNSF